MSTNAVVKRDPRMDTIAGLLEKSKASIHAVVPKHLDPDRLTKIALVAISRVPKLLECTPSSLLQAVMRAAELGLDCGGNLGSGYLVPYGKEVQFIPGYRGLIDLAMRSGKLASIDPPQLVYANEKFRLVKGTSPSIIHEPLTDGDEPGDLIGAYIVWRTKESPDRPIFEWMTVVQIDAIRKRSKASSNGPWVTDYHEMARKTVVRRAAKYMPLSVESADAIATLDREEFDNDPIDVVVVDEERHGSRTAAMREAMKPKAQPPTPQQPAAPVPVETIQEPPFEVDYGDPPSIPPEPPVDECEALRAALREALKAVDGGRLALKLAAAEIGIKPAELPAVIDREFDPAVLSTILEIVRSAAMAPTAKGRRA